ncbi:hypothetical protein ACFU7B_17690, partial [Streptomyces sp. NPDC057545]
MSTSEQGTPHMSHNQPGPYGQQPPQGQPNPYGAQPPRRANAPTERARTPMQPPGESPPDPAGGPVPR